jgi:myosin-crossreactive antigen
MRIEIDTVKKEIVIHEATTEELLDTFKDYLGYKVISKIVTINSWPIYNPYIEPYVDPNIDPINPVFPYCGTTSGDFKFKKDE